MFLGIDIGTHVARAATLDKTGTPRLLRLGDGSESMPAMARQTMHGLQIGAEAALALAGNAETTLCGCTRLLGRPAQLPSSVTAQLPYTVRIVDGEAICNLLYAEVSAGEVYGLLVRALVEEAQMTTGADVEGVALTVPASADDRFRIQARAAVEAQGIPVRRLVNQPTAALLAATLPGDARRIAVVYCGDGSTDVTVAERTRKQIRILATAGDMWMGGDDLVWTVTKQINQRLNKQAGVDVFRVDRGGLTAFGLRHAVEAAMRECAHRPATTVVLDHGGGFGRDVRTAITRQDVDHWLVPAFKRISKLCRQALSASKVEVHRVDAVLLVGDSTWLPGLREQIADLFARPVRQVEVRDAAVLPVYGSALMAATDSTLAWDVTPYALGINCYFAEEELFSPIVAANTPIPTPKAGARGAHSEEYRTRFPDQRSVMLDVLQYRGARNANPYGTERVLPNRCELLGSWQFDGLSPAKGKHAAFNVTFHIDQDGILHLLAHETATGHRLSAKVDRTIG